MKHKEDYHKSIITLLQGLHRQYPKKELSVHLYGALIEWDGEFWGISDKEMFNALEKYSQQLSIEEEPEDITEIYRDALNLSMESFDEEDDY